MKHALLAVALLGLGFCGPGPKTQRQCRVDPVTGDKRLFRYEDNGTHVTLFDYKSKRKKGTAGAPETWAQRSEGHRGRTFYCCGIKRKHIDDLTEQDVEDAAHTPLIITGLVDK